MYLNLEAELKRAAITRALLASELKVNISTISHKLNNPNRLKLCDAFEIKNIFFPNMTIEYLFEWKE